MSTATHTPRSSLHRTSHNNYEIQSQHVLQNRSGVDKDVNCAKMLVILVTGEQRLITFTLPQESCTVQDLLEQVGVSFDNTTTIRCVENPGEQIDFVVTVGFSVQESASELISRAIKTSQVTKQERSVNNIATTSVAASSNAPSAVLNLPIIQGYLAVCQSCGFGGDDHAKCERCKHIFREPPKRVPHNKSNGQTAREASCTDTDQASNENRLKDIPSQSRGCKANAVSLNANAFRRLRSGRQKIESEPVIVTLSSDEEADYENTNKGVTNVSSINSANIAGTLSINCKPFSFEPMIQKKDESSTYAASETTQTVKSAPETRLFTKTDKTDECTYRSFTEFERCDVTDLSNSSDKLITSLKCKLIRIGTYSFEPKENVIFTSKGIKIVAPLCNDATVTCSLHICKPEVVKIIAHFSHNSDSMFCFYTLRMCAQYVRNSLNMKDVKSPAVGSGVYFCADGPYQMRKIILQFESITEQAMNVIKSIWGFFDEISFTDAQDLLKRAAHADRQATGKSNEDSPPTIVHLNPNEIRQLLIYPPGKGGISINTEDYMCLATDQYLNDIIIDFYLKWVHNNVIPDSQRDRTFIFSTFFYKRLTTLTRHVVQDKEIRQTSAQKRHARVQNWTKNVNLFDKDFIIIPINEQSHWFLAIYCFPKLKGPVTFDTNIPVGPQQLKKQKSKKVALQIDNSTVTSLSKRESVNTAFEDSERDEAEGDESELASEDSDFDSAAISGNTNNNNNCTPASSVNNLPQTQAIKQPLILIFDSLAGASRKRVFATLRDYLTCEYNLKMSESNGPHTFNKENMPGHCVKVPQQNNFADCGLYLLQYVEHFFKDPIRDYRLPIKQLKNWFDTTTVTKKREDVAILLQSLMSEDNGTNQQVILPKISFPTLNGQLVEQEESCNAEYLDFEEEMEEEVSVDADAITYSTSELDVENMSHKKNCKRNVPNAAKPPALFSPKNGRKFVAKRRLQISGSNNNEKSSGPAKDRSRNKLRRKFEQ